MHYTTCFFLTEADDERTNVQQTQELTITHINTVGSCELNYRYFVYPHSIPSWYPTHNAKYAFVLAFEIGLK